jgi:hypothetical protein
MLVVEYRFEQLFHWFIPFLTVRYSHKIWGTGIPVQFRGLPNFFLRKSKLCCAVMGENNR